MIGLLQGTVADLSGDTLILDVGGVGYEVAVTAAVLDRFGKVDEKARLVVYTDVKENSILLYGFISPLEKQVFLLLRKVKGIGSKIALSVVSTLGAEEVLAGIGRGDMSLFRRVSGVGGKTAERVIVELREAVAEYVSGDFRSPVGTGTSGKASLPSVPLNGGIEADVVLALERLGFPAERARQVVTMTVEGMGVEKDRSGSSRTQLLADSGELLRLALANIQ